MSLEARNEDDHHPHRRRYRPFPYGSWLRQPFGGRCGTYVSSSMYSSYSCRELNVEAQRVSAAAAAAAGVQDSARTRDAVATTAALVVFWPAAFFVGGNSAQTAELARLKGQMQAIEEASIQKRCGIAFRRH